MTQLCIHPERPLHMLDALDGQTVAVAACEDDAMNICLIVNSHDALVGALEQCAELLGMLARPDGRPESISHIWARCVELEARARTALAQQRS